MNLKKDHKTIECSYVIESRDYCIVNNAKPKFKKKNNHGIVFKSLENFFNSCHNYGVYIIVLFLKLPCNKH